MKTISCPSCGAEMKAEQYLCNKCNNRKPPLKVCPACGHLVSIMALNCPRCGHPITRPMISQQEEEEKVPRYNKLRSCPACDETIGRNAYECPYCGWVNTDWKDRSKLFKWAAIVIIIPAVAAVVSFILSLLYFLSLYLSLTQR